MSEDVKVVSWSDPIESDLPPEEMITLSRLLKMKSENELLTIENFVKRFNIVENTRTIRRIFLSLCESNHIKKIIKRSENGSFVSFSYKLNFIYQDQQKQSLSPFDKNVQWKDEKESLVESSIGHNVINDLQEEKKLDGELSNYIKDKNKDKNNSFYIFLNNKKYRKLKKEKELTSKKTEVKEKETFSGTTNLPSFINQCFIQEKEVFDYWNGLGSPLTVHQLKSFYPRRNKHGHPVLGMRDDIHFKLNKYTIMEIKIRIKRYFDLLNNKELALNTKFFGTIVKLDTFLKGFNDWERFELVKKNQKQLLKIDSWFDECKSNENLEKYLSYITSPDNEEFTKLFKITFLIKALHKNINPNEDPNIHFTSKEINQMNLGSNRLLKFYNELNDTRQFIFRVSHQKFIDKFVGIVKGQFPKSTICPGNLVSNHTFNKVFTLVYLKKIEMVGR